MPQSATFTHSRTRIPAFSHFDFFGLRLEKCKTCISKISNKFLTDSAVSRKKVVLYYVSSVNKFLVKNINAFNI